MKLANLLIGIVMMGFVIGIAGTYYNNIATAYDKPFNISYYDPYKENDEVNILTDELGGNVTLGASSSNGLFDSITTGTIGSVVRSIIRLPTIISHIIGNLENDIGLPRGFFAIVGIIFGITLIFLIVSAVLKWRFQSD